MASDAPEDGDPVPHRAPGDLAPTGSAACGATIAPQATALEERIEPSREQIGRFQREALITARLHHPGIVPVYEAGRGPTGEPCFAMKLVPGRPLDRVIGEARSLDERLALLPRIAAVVDAIAYAHRQRVIHRDLKPANILIGDLGETVVIDWGLAKHLDDDDPAVIGTSAYMAPEQARGEPVDQCADVFALGAMLYHLLAGVPPYNAPTATELTAAAAAGKVVPVTERERGAPPDLVAIVQRAMSPLPIERYGDAGELASELRRFLTGRLVSAHRYTAAHRVGRFVRRRRAAVTIAALAAIGLAAGGMFAVRGILRERDIADHERTVADTRRQAAEHLIDRMLSDARRRLQQIGRLDLLASLGTEIRDYYRTLATIPGGMPADDVDRMAAAVDLIGLAERDAGKLDDALATWTETRATLTRAAATSTGERARAERRMIARLDFEIGTIHQQRGKIAAALTAYNQAKREFAALRNDSPNDRAVLLGAADAHDRVGDLQRIAGRLDEAFLEYSEARLDRERAANTPGSRPPDDVLALSTSHLKLGSVYQARGESAKALEEYRACLRLRTAMLDGARDDVELQNRVLELVAEVHAALAELASAGGDTQAAAAEWRAVRDTLEPLARGGQLSAQRRPLLDRAQTYR